MNKVLILAGLTVLIGSLAYLTADTKTQESSGFAEYKQHFNKRYGATEDAYREQIYNTNMLEAKIHNANPESTWTMGETQFTDLTQEEFVGIYLTPEKDSTDLQFPVFQGAEATQDSVDWRTVKGTATHVKNQGQCGSCWAFSTVGAVEAYQATVKGQLDLDLSEQQLVDCDKYSYGCDGGYKDMALKWVQVNGLQIQSAYPYTARDDTCKFAGGDYKIGGVLAVESNDAGLKAALSLRPVAVSVDASNWSRYTGGVFDSCNNQGTNHAVLAFGYNSESWLVKNSWGQSWGETGFIRLSLGNTCSVTSKIFIAV